MKINKNPRIIIAGSVNSSRITLEKLVENEMNVVGALGLHPDAAKKVSGFQDLKPIAEQSGVDFQYFSKINAHHTIDFIRKKEPDLLFVVGLSQIVKKDLLNIPAYGCIGYHPTKLPEGRGRGAMAWLVLGQARPAASFFLMDEGMDSGPIWVQEPYKIDENDYVQDAINKVIDAIGTALDKKLPELNEGLFEVSPQDASKATYLGKRAPEDGFIDWTQSAEDIHRLIKSVSKPLPGAFTYYHGYKLIIWKADIIDDHKYLGVIGRILNIDESGILVQSGKGCILIKEYETSGEIKLNVGKKLGLDLPELYETIIHKL